MFNLRVYGILQRADKAVLVSDEWIRGNYYTKFPGGGLEFGEGTRECLAREFKEEMDLNVSVEEHLYTTDFFQLSAFAPDQQIISIYYRVSTLETIKVPLTTIPFTFAANQLTQYEETGETESFRFIEWEKFDPHHLSLPIDKKVAELLLKA